MFDTGNPQIKGPGIYKITNTDTGRFYIGQSKNLVNRWKSHLKNLQANKHANKFFQNDFNKSKKKFLNFNFLKFEILESMEASSKEERNRKEQYYINLFYDNKVQCYNIEKTINHPGSKTFSHTPIETKLKLSKSVKKLWLDPDYKKKMELAKIKKSNSMKIVCSNKEYKLKHKNMMSDKWKDPEYKARVSEAIKRSYSKNSELKEKISNKSKELWKNQDFKIKVSNSIKASYKKRFNKIKAVILDPNGEEFNVYNIAEFAKDHNLNRRSLNSVILGDRKSINGWVLKK